MREHVVGQMDKNRDRMISLKEFLQDTEAQAMPPGKDPGWEDLSEQKIYSSEELKKFEEEYAKQQKWGEHAYDPATKAPSQPEQVVPVHPQQNQQQQHIPDPHRLPELQPIQPIPSDKIQKTVDPVYGI